MFSPPTLKPASNTELKYCSVSGMLMLLMVEVLKQCYGLSLMLCHAFKPFSSSFKIYSHTKLWFILYFHLFFYESPVVFVWRQKFFSYSFRDSMGGTCNGIHRYTDGSSLPSSSASLWMGNDQYSSPIYLLLPMGLTALPLLWASLTPNRITFQLHFILFPSAHTNTYALYFSTLCLCFLLLSLLDSMNLTNFDSKENTSVLWLCLLESCSYSALSTTTRMTSVSACHTPPTN